MDENSRSLWLLLSFLLVFLMIPGLGLIGSGCVRKRHSLSQLSGAFLLLIHGTLLFGFIGYGIIFGKEFFFFQNLSLFPRGGVSHSLLFLFQSLFFCLSLVILQGVWAERARQVPFLIFSLLWGCLVYFPLGFLLWGKGSPFENWEIIDFAGGLNVHVSTGFSALAMTLAAGRRADYFNLKFKFSNTSIFLGTLFLWLGWIGFNAGSSLVLGSESIQATLTTILSAISSCVTWYWVDKLHTPHKSTLKGFVLGLVSGLVAITPTCAFISTGGSLFLGATAGIIGNYSIRLMNKTFKQDDVLEVFSTHGVCGVYGTLFGLLFIGKQSFSLGHQLGITGIVAVYSFVLTFGLIKVMGINRLLIEKSEDSLGLDQIEHGESVLNLGAGS